MTKIEVQGAILSERPDGTRVLEVSSKIGQYQLEFSPKQWALLADSAKWFSEHVTTCLNGESNET